jgi:hypothetical protein
MLLIKEHERTRIHMQGRLHLFTPQVRSQVNDSIIKTTRLPIGRSFYSTFDESNWHYMHIAQEERNGHYIDQR